MDRTGNETLTQVGPGTPMGELMRQYWLPAILSGELVVGTPVRLMLLGERLIAFRTGSGAVGIMDHRCPHRRASLFYGRVEDDGIRCAYHGWKFKPDGACVEQPNIDPSPGCVGVRAKGYPTHEQGGLVWVYMGPRSDPPPLPDFPVLSLPQERVSVWCELRECNYLQCLEGEIDTSHAGFLHLGLVQRDTDATQSNGLAVDTHVRAVRYKTTETGAGVLAGGYRPSGKKELYWRFANFLLPFWTQPPPCEFGTEAVARAWVPMDDTHTMLFSISTNTFLLSSHENAILPDPNPGMTFSYEWLPNTTDWYGRWRLAQNQYNDYMIDRDVQRDQSYSGIEGLDVQDMAIQESMGPLVDRSLEHLVASDVAVVQARRRLLKAAAALRDSGIAPPGVDNPTAYRTWCGFLTAPAGDDWQEIYKRATPDGVEPKARSTGLQYGN